MTVLYCPVCQSYEEEPKVAEDGKYYCPTCVLLRKKQSELDEEDETVALLNHVHAVEGYLFDIKQLLTRILGHLKVNP